MKWSLIFTVTPIRCRTRSRIPVADHAAARLTRGLRPRLRGAGLRHLPHPRPRRAPATHGRQWGCWGRDRRCRRNRPVATLPAALDRAQTIQAARPHELAAASPGHLPAAPSFTDREHDSGRSSGSVRSSASGTARS